jgi:purine-binding chemotaxis protein CheW
MGDADVIDHPLTREETERILDARGRRLATQHVENEEAEASSLQVAVFELGGVRYGLEARFVREVTRLADFVSVPGAPAFVAGLTAYRGEILALFDLEQILGLPTRGVTDRGRAVVCGRTTDEFALLADFVHALIPLPPSAVRSPPPTYPRRGLRLVNGVTTDGLVLLDGDALLADPDLFVDRNAHPPT